MTSRIFVACPIGDESSPARRRSDQLLKHVIAPVASSMGQLHVVRADQMGQPGRISVQVLRELRDCDVLIADLSELNPNVLYEFGIRQALVKPYVLMAEKGQKLPFDLADLRTIFYQLDLDGVDTAQAELRKHLDAALKGDALAVDTELFGGTARPPRPQGDETAFLQISETFGSLRATQSEILESQARIEKQIADLPQNAKSPSGQEIGFILMKSMLEDPDKFERMMPLIERVSAMGRVNGGQQPPAARRK